MLPSRVSLSVSPIVLTIVLLAAPWHAAADPPLGENLLTNPGFSGAWGWSTETGGWGTRSSDPSPQGGSYFFAYDSAYTTIYQQFDLVSLGFDAHRLGTGGYYVNYGGYQRSKDQSWPFDEDDGLIQVTMHDGGTQIGQHNLGWYDGTTWALRGSTVRLAAGATRLKYLFHAERDTPLGDNDAYLDGAYLDLNEYNIWTWGDNSHNYAGAGPWTGSATFLIGDGGAGGLSVTNAAVMTTNGTTYLGELASGSGTVNVHGGVWNAVGDVFVGVVGAGQLDVAGGTMNVANQLTVGANGTLTTDGQLSLGGAGAVTIGGTLTLDGGRIAMPTFDNTSGTFQFSGGTMAFLDDFAVDSAALFGAVGGDAISTGRALEVADTLTIGALGELTLSGGRVAATTFDHSSGGTFQFSSGTLAFLDDFAVDSATPFGAVGGDDISTGRTLEVADTLTIGPLGVLTLNDGRIAVAAIDNTSGGTFQFTSGTFAFLGDLTIDSTTPFGAVGGDAITTGRVLEVSNTLAIGAAGELTLNDGHVTCGTFTVTSGGTFAHGAGVLEIVGGVFDPGTAGYTIDGPGNPTLEFAGGGTTLSGQLRVADTQDGTLAVSGGGVIESATGSIGYATGSLGNATIDGAGSAWNLTDSLFLSGSATAAGGAGSLAVQNGGAVEVTNTLKIWNDGALTLDGGRIAVATFDNTSGGAFQFTDGTLAFLGSLTVDSDAPFSAVGGDAISTGRTLEVASALTIGAAGELTLSGGAIACNTFSNASGGTFMHDSSTLTVTGGTFDPGSGDYSIDGAAPPNEPTVRLAGGAAASLTGNLNVGYDAAGALEIVDGATVAASGSGYVAANTGSEGAVTVDGGGSTWTHTGDVFVGNYGAGTMDITDGAVVADTLGKIGRYVGSDGAVLVDGIGSTWTNAGYVTVAAYGVGRLDVTDGGSVSSASGYIGRHFDSSGIVEIDGAGSAWTLAGSLFVGGTDNTARGAGRLTVQNDGAVDVAGMLRVWSPGTFELLGGQVDVSSFDVSSGGTFTHDAGTLTVTGGTFSPVPGGHMIDGAGNPTIILEGSSATLSGPLWVGHLGSGTLEITSGGSVSNTYCRIGNEPGSQGAVTVDGSSWINSQYLYVGDDGNGTLTIQSGGNAQNTYSYIGHVADSLGEVTVDGTGSVWTLTDSLYIGGSSTAAGGAGVLTVQNGGAVDVVNTLKLWDTGSLTLNGGRIASTTFDNTAGGTFQFNAGTLAFNNHLPINTAAPFNAVGGDALSAARTLEVANTLTLGPAGELTLSGGRVECTSFVNTSGGDFYFNDGTLAFRGNLYITSATPMNADGGDAISPGRILEVAQTLYVDNGAGVSLDVTGGNVQSTVGYIGTAATDHGKVTVDGVGALWGVDEYLCVGRFGNGTLDITGGGRVEDVDGYIASQDDSTGSVTVDGIGTGDVRSTWHNTGNLFVANRGTGTLLITAGATVHVGDSTFIAMDAGYGADGDVTVDGDGSTLTVDDSLFVGGSNTAAGGLGELIVRNDGAVDVTGTLKVWNTGRVELLGSQINAGSFIVEPGGAFLHDAGTLTVTGGVFNPTPGAYMIDGIDNPTIILEDSGATFSGPLSVGVADRGTLEITAGGNVSSTYCAIGELHLSEGTVTVDAATWTNSQDIYVGNDAAGTLTIRGGGNVETPFGYIGRFGNAAGTAIVDGAGSVWNVTDSLFVGGNDTAVGGMGVLIVENDGTVEVTNTLRLWSSGTLTLNGGTVQAGEFDLAAGMFQFNSGTLHDTNDLTFQASDGILGGAQAVRFARHLRVDGTTTLVDVLTLDGGTFSTGALVNPQLLEFNRGVLNLTGDDLTIGPAGLFGAALSLTGNKAIHVTNHTTVGASGQLVLDGGTFSSNTMTNLGLIRGSGTIGGTLDNGTTGTILATAADYLELTGSLSNAGQINLIGGTIRVAGATTNAPDGVISGHGGLRFEGGLTNHGVMNFGADTEIYGDMVNGEPDQMGTDGEIVVSGGASVAFHGDVVSNGTKFKIGDFADVVFFAALSGAGSFSGRGGVSIEGTYSPGNSPGRVALDGDLTLGAGATLEIELGGTNAGAEYDVVIVQGTASLGGTLDVTLIDGFQPTLGDVFDIFDFASQSGAFDEVFLPELSESLRWDVSRLSAGGMLTVVPEPSTLALTAIGLLALLGRRRRRQ